MLGQVLLPSVSAHADSSMCIWVRKKTLQFLLLLATLSPYRFMSHVILQEVQRKCSPANGYVRTCYPIFHASWLLIAGGGDGGHAKAAEKSRKDEIEVEKKRIREVSAASQ